MDNAALQNDLLRLFARHDVQLDVDEDGWLTTDGDFPAVRAQWHAGSADAPGHLDIDVVLSEERCIEESFAGHGADDRTDAMRAFEHTALPPLLAACWYVTDTRRVTYSAWEIGVRTWDVFAGPWTLHGVDITDLERLDQVPDAIHAALQRESLTPELHWLRLVHRQTADGDAQCEALLDNEAWPAGSNALAALAWPQSGEYSAHGFVMVDVRDY